MTSGIPGLPTGVPGVPTGIPGVPTGDLLQSLRADLSSLVRQQFQSVVQEYLGKAGQGRTGARLLGGSAVLGSMAAGSATALAIRLLERRPATAPALTAALFGAAAAALVARGREQMRRAWSPLPQGTVAGPA
jgi:Putative Actinobacterial Holin-X, holin superfamily III